MDHNDTGDNAAHNAILAEERRKLSRQKEIAAAMEEGVKKFIAEALKDDLTKQNLGKEGVRTMQQAQQGVDPVREFLKGKNSEQFGGLVDDFTGINEDKPWERE